MIIIRKTDNKLESSYISCGDIKRYSCKSLKVELPHYPANLLLCKWWYKWKCDHKKKNMNSYSNIIHSIKKQGKKLQMSVNWWTSKQNVVCLYNDIKSDNKKNEVLIHATTWVNPEKIMLWKKSTRKPPQYCIILFLLNGQKRQTYGDWLETSGCPGLGVAERREVTVMGRGLS